MSDCQCLLVGSGHLGSRYLQGLVYVDRPLQITIVDPFQESLDRARRLASEVIPSTQHRMLFTTSLDEAPKQIDLAIVATPAHCRAEVISAICLKHRPESWILEKLLAQSSHQIGQIESLLASHPRVWVNTSRRAIEWHQNIKKLICNDCIAPLRVRINGGQWGLACNAIHFIDLVGWWTDSVVKTVNCDGLKYWKPSKRKGFQEVYGSLLIEFQDNSLLELACDQSDVGLQIEVESVAGKWIINETSGSATSPSGQKILGHIPFQSILTTSLVEKIISSGSCDLTDLAESAAQHRPFLNSLLKHWNNCQLRKDLVVPIT